MKVKIVLLLLAVFCFLFANGKLSEINAQEYGHRNIKPQLVTLFSHHKYNNIARAIFNFELGVRGDSKSPQTFNDYDLRYSGNSPDGTLDWFDISNSERSFTQIIDMGSLDWADIYDIPYLYVSSEPHSGMWRIDIAKGNVVKITPENALVKVVAGDMYLMHIKENNYAKEVARDFYAMFRVESLKSGDEVTISWKLVPSPEMDKP